METAGMDDRRKPSLFYHVRRLAITKQPALFLVCQRCVGAAVRRLLMADAVDRLRCVLGLNRPETAVEATGIVGVADVPLQRSHLLIVRHQPRERRRLRNVHAAGDEVLECLGSPVHVLRVVVEGQLDVDVSSFMVSSYGKA